MFIWLILIALVFRCQGQTEMFGGRLVSASDSLPLVSAHVRIVGSHAGCTTDPNGRFSMSVNSFPVEIRVSHIGYLDTFIHIKSRPGHPLMIALKEKSTELGEVTIVANRIVNLNAKQSLYVWDYQLQKDGILLLANCNKSAWDQRLILLSRNGDTLASKKTSQAKELKADPLGYRHLLDSKTAYQIFLNLPDIDLIYPYERTHFEEIMAPIAGGNQGCLIIRQNAFSNQVLRYTLHNVNNGESTLLCEIADEDGLIRLGDRQRLSSMPGFDEADMRFEEMCFYAPIYAPVFIQGDSIILFNLVEHQIQIYTLNAEPIRSIEFNPEMESHWDRNILHDRESGEFYAVFERSGIYSLRRVNLINGSLGAPIIIPELPHIEKMQVEGSRLYFLYQDICGSLKQLYRMDL
jgi:hypothetical protein